MDELDFFKFQITAMNYFAPAFSSENVSLVQYHAAGVPVRIFSKKSQQNLTLPLMVYFHGSGYCFNYGGITKQLLLWHLT
jgi:acetyl esterase/lipase